MKCSTHFAVRNLREAQDCKRRRKDILRQPCDMRFAEPWTKPALGTWVLVHWVLWASSWTMLAFSLNFWLRSFTGRKIASSRHFSTRDFYRFFLLSIIAPSQQIHVLQIHLQHRARPENPCGKAQGKWGVTNAHVNNEENPVACRYPLKTNGWNLKITQLKRKIIWTKKPLFWVQNVSFRGCI